MKNMFKIMKIICIVFIVLTFPAYSSSNLQNITTEIKNIKNFITSSKNEYNNLQEELKNSDLTIGQLSVKSHNIEKQVIQQKKSLEQLRQKRQLYQNQLSMEQNQLADQIRTVYMMGREPYIKLLLNQQNVSQLSRTLTYYHYLMQAQLQAMTPIKITLNALNHTTFEIQTKLAALQQAQLQLKTSRNELHQKHVQREKILQVLTKRIQSDQQKLQNLLANKRKLEQVVVTIAGKKMSIPEGSPFSSLRGKLPWPTKGTVIVHFGDPIFNSQIHWDGMLIRAKEGQNVYAIANGRTVFANWMPGFGLLLIVQHDHGYMTIYGHNKSLYKNVGDVVKPGDLLATVGDSGGNLVAALYFAIRHNGQALNPLQWLG